MNILIPDSWLRDFLKTDASPKEIQEALSLCSASVDRLIKVGDDHVYDIEVTTNRVDQMSVLGIAREAAAILPQFGHKAKLLKNPLSQNSVFGKTKVDYLTVQIDPNLCFRFSAALITNTSLKPSPDWMKKRLELSGMRSINSTVDISNYLMHELGQPVHTFDYDKISGHKMILRNSRKGEKITTLDGKTHILPGNDIVIEDGSGKLIDLCGIMGGKNSAVDENTKNVLLFVQTYSGSHIRKTSMSLAHRTQAAVLFEKDLPVENVLPTLGEGINHFTKLTDGKAKTDILDILLKHPKQTNIRIDPDFINSRLGITLSNKQINDILTRLNLDSPQRRNDLSLPEDIVEEVARVYGYHNLPSRLMTGSIPTDRPDNKTFFWENKIKLALKYWGFTETYTYSLVDSDTGLKLKNPLSSEWTHLRTKLTPSHLKIVSQNLGRTTELNLFEIANVYIPRKNDLPEEQLRLILTTTHDNHFLKGIIEGLSDELGVKLPGDVFTHDACLTWEIPLMPIISKATTTREYSPISKFSPIVEDVNITLSESYDALVKKIKSISPLIQKVELVDKYGSKLTLRLTFHSPTHQLSSSDLEPFRKKLTGL